MNYLWSLSLNEDISISADFIEWPGCRGASMFIMLPLTSLLLWVWTWRPLAGNFQPVVIIKWYIYREIYEKNIQFIISIWLGQPLSRASASLAKRSHGPNSATSQMRLAPSWRLECVNMGGGRCCSRLYRTLRDTSWYLAMCICAY